MNERANIFGVLRQREMNSFPEIHSHTKRGGANVMSLPIYWLSISQGTLNYRECAGTTRPYSWVCKQKSLMVNKYDKDWFLSNLHYKDYPCFIFEISFQTFQKVRAKQSSWLFLKWLNDKVRGKNWNLSLQNTFVTF